MASTTSIGSTSPDRPSGLRVAAFWAMGAAIAVAAVLYLFGSLSWIDRPYPGFKVRLDRAVELQLPPSSTGAQAGLLPGDRIVAVDGRALVDPRARYAYVASRPIGTPIAYDLERHLPNGDTRRLHKTIATQRHDVRQWASIFLALWLTGLSFLVLGTAVSALKPGDPLARANFAFHMAGAIACFSIFDQSTTYFSPFQDPAKLLQWVIAVCFANLALQFPRRYPMLETARRVNWVAGVSLAAVLLAAYAAQRGLFWVTFAHLGYVAVAELVLLGNALWTMLSPGSSPREKGQGKALLIGTLVSTVPALLVPQAHLLGVHVDLEGLENVALPLWPLAISYAIARHQLFDIGPLLRRSLTYLVSACVLTLLYGLSTTAAEHVLGGQGRLSGLVGTLLVAFAFAPVRDQVKAWLDARFFRSPYRFSEVIAGFTSVAQDSTDPHVLMRAYLDALDGALAPTRMAIVVNEDGPRAVATRGFDEREAEAIALNPGGEPLLCVPLAVQGHALGQVVVGPKKSELAYSAPDRALIAELTQSLAVWLDLFARFDKVRLQTQEIEALKRSEAMQGQFLNVVSHELKIPLSVIMSSLNILKRIEDGHDPKTLGHLNRIRRSLTHLVGLVGDLLDAGQLQSGHFALRTRDVPLAALAEDTVAEMRPLAEAKSQSLSAALDPALPAIQADGVRVAQVIRNLLHTAIRYTPAGGHMHLSLTADGDMLRCTVSDDGPGIDPAAMPHLFERFRQAQSQTSDRDQGVGLGLFISKAIVEAHGGSIGVESRPGQGSTFWFTLPARADTPALPRGAGVPAGGSAPADDQAR
jgi:signal transduction histidine kinase